MKNLYTLQTLLVLILFSMIPSWAYSQFSEPTVVKVRNSGTTYSDQFAAPSGYSNEIISETSPQLGTINLVPGTGNTLQLNYTPDPGALGTNDVVIQYYSMSVPMHPITKSYRFLIVNEVVSIGDDRYVVDAGAIEISLDVLQNDSVSNGDLIISTVSISNDGLAVVNGGGDAIIFTPDADFTGDTWIQYVTCDDDGNCGQGNVHVLVRDPNVQDDLEFSKFLLNTDELDVVMPFADFTVLNSPLHGTLTQAGTLGWIYTPELGYTGQDTFELDLLNLVSRKYTISVYAKNYNIHARNDRFYVRPNLSVTFNVLNNDLLDYDVSSRTNPNKGVLSEVSNGVYTYTPNTGFRGVDKFTYTTCFDDTVYCETATV
ncbi:MAG: Ig-like domain-containing protein, partial [Bacteroidota bacterium]|nr:Ig-like domain-containing protein [Bacteroidota bacterium]